MTDPNVAAHARALVADDRAARRARWESALVEARREQHWAEARGDDGSARLWRAIVAEIQRGLETLAD